MLCKQQEKLLTLKQTDCVIIPQHIVKSHCLHFDFRLFVPVTSVAVAFLMVNAI